VDVRERGECYVVVVGVDEVVGVVGAVGVVDVVGVVVVVGVVDMVVVVGVVGVAAPVGIGLFLLVAYLQLSAMEELTLQIWVEMVV
jgi:hypothetical protein